MRHSRSRWRGHRRTATLNAAAITVLLLDDHEVVRRGVRDLLESEIDITVVGEASTEHDAVLQVTALDPDVAILDVRLAEGNGVTGVSTDPLDDTRAPHA